MERLNRILEIDEANLLAVVEPNVITGDLQRAVERVGLFYPPDPASLDTSSIGGNVAECAGGPRAFKYGTTKRYVLALEAVLPTGEIVRHRLEGGEERRRLRPDAAAGRVGRHARHHHEDHAAADPEAAGARDAARRSFADVRSAVDAVSALIARAWCRRRSSSSTRTRCGRSRAHVGSVGGAGQARGACSSSNATARRRPSRRRSPASRRRAATPARSRSRRADERSGARRALGRPPRRSRWR